MTKISKQIKLQAIQDYLFGKYTIRGITARYGIAKSVFQMLIAAYRSLGPDILFNPPVITPGFRVKVASWAIQNNASHSQVAAEFGYTGIAQLEDENLRLKIENETLKLLASIQQRTDNSQE